MPNRSIINSLLQKAHSNYPGAIAIYPILNKEFSEREPFKYIEIIDEMVRHELVWNNFADLITILPKGIKIIESGGYIRYLEEKASKRRQEKEYKI